MKEKSVGNKKEKTKKDIIETEKIRLVKEETEEEIPTLPENAVVKEKEKSEIKIPKGRNLSEKLTELYKKDKDGFESLKERLGGERIYRFIDVKKPDGTSERKMQYLSLNNIQRDDKGNWKGDLTIYDENGAEQKNIKDYNISKVRHREWKTTKKEPKSGDVYVAEKGNPIRLNVERVAFNVDKNKTEDMFILKNQANGKDGRSRSLYQLREYEGIFKDAVKSRSEALQKYKRETESDLVRINDFFDETGGQIKTERVKKQREEEGGVENNAAKAIRQKEERLTDLKNKLTQSDYVLNYTKFEPQTVIRWLKAFSGAFLYTLTLSRFETKEFIKLSNTYDDFHKKKSEIEALEQELGYLYQAYQEQKELKEQPLIP